MGQVTLLSGARTTRLFQFRWSVNNDFPLVSDQIYLTFDRPRGSSPVSSPEVRREAVKRFPSFRFFRTLKHNNNMIRNPFKITINKKGQDYTAFFHALSETQKNPDHLALYMIPPTGAFFEDPETVKKELQKAGFIKVSYMYTDEAEVDVIVFRARREDIRDIVTGEEKNLVRISKENLQSH